MTSRNGASTNRSPSSEREHLLNRLKVAIWSDDVVWASFLVGSLASNTADELSDVDLYVYTQGERWSGQHLDEWLKHNALRADLHYWTGTYKHRMLIEGVRVDLTVQPKARLAEIETWPELFFGASDIIKDADGTLHAQLAMPRPSVDRAETNDRDGFVFNLFAVAIQFVRGEVLSAKVLSVSLIESQARLNHGIDSGSTHSKEASRHLERRTANESNLARLYALAFQDGPDTLARWLHDELALVIKDDSQHLATRIFANNLATAIDARADS